MTHGRSLPTEPWAHARLTREPSRAKTLPRHRVEGDVLDGALGPLDKLGCHWTEMAGSSFCRARRLGTPLLPFASAMPAQSCLKQVAPGVTRQGSPQASSPKRGASTEHRRKSARRLAWLAGLTRGHCSFEGCLAAEQATPRKNLCTFAQREGTA